MYTEYEILHPQFAVGVVYYTDDDGEDYNVTVTYYSTWDNPSNSCWVVPGTLRDI